ncbi:hypothetical protein PanWU01x14_285000, partial [Parasponia andersonii]
NVSTHNSENRSKYLYPLAQESSSITSQMKGYSYTVESMSPINYFKNRYHKASGWRNEYTQ